jgi:hypothetical protein
MQITPSTGAAASVATGTISDQATTGALTDGTYFGIDMVNWNLYSIDLARAQQLRSALVQPELRYLWQSAVPTQACPGPQKCFITPLVTAGRVVVAPCLTRCIKSIPKMERLWPAFK